ncbi:MAG: substrate-binding domain-containing protein [Pseudorhodoplanes sp.]
MATQTIGMIFPTPEHQNYTRMAAQLQKTARAEGYNLLLGCTQYDSEATMRHARDMIALGVKGLVAIGAEQPDGFFELIDSHKLPLCLLYVNPGGAPGRDALRFDNAATFGAIADYLMDLGHTAIGYIGPGAFNPRAQARQVGIRAALAKRGLLFPDHHVIATQWDTQSGKDAFRRIMTTPEPPTAIICGNDYHAFGCVIAAQEMGISIPGSVSITGFGDIDLCDFIHPRLTSMGVADRKVADAIGRHLIGLIAGKTGPLDVSADPKLVVRGSTAPPRTGRG